MLNKFGTESKPFITGPSVHNQRIERLWKDVVTYVVSHHRNLFYHLEDESLLDPVNSIHLFALEYVFIPRINKNLIQFIASWNNHPMRTASSKSPVQVWTEGVYRNVRDGCLIDYDHEVDDFYGVDFGGPNPELRTANDIQIPDLDLELTEDQKGEIYAINPLDDDNNNGVEHYLRIVRIIDG